MSDFGAQGGGGAIGFEQPGPSQGYVPPPGPSTYQPGTSDFPPANPPRPSASDTLNLPGSNTSPNDAQTGTHAPPSTPQDPQNSTKPVPQQVSYNAEWKPPPNTGL